MTITKLLPISKGRVKVYIDGEYYFALYARERYRYKVEENTEMEESVVEEILSKVILKRAKSKAMNLLQNQDRSIKDIRDHLRRADYRDDVIDQVILFLEEYHYVDDLRYARQYIFFKNDSRSRGEIRMKLKQKGVTEEVIDQAFAEMESELTSEEEVLDELFQKKISKMDLAAMEAKDWDRIYRFFLRKGFSSSDILHKISGLRND